jgi:formate--tetrahydrofolate ligase
VFCRDLKADGAMTVLLKDAMQPNLVQTLENNPAFVHGGPFANIAHGCNSVSATQTALRLADYVVTEAGFGADLGAEKFFDIKCRKAGLKPAAAVIVATVRAMKMNGGVAKADLGDRERGGGAEGLCQPRPAHRQCEGLRRAGGGGDQPFRRRQRGRDRRGAGLCCGAGLRGDPVPALGRGLGRRRGAGAPGGRTGRCRRGQFRPALPDAMPLFEKIETIAKRIYHADEVLADKKVRDQLREWEAAGYGHLPICMAKTQYSFSTDPNLRGAPTGHSVPVREVRLSAGAGFVVVICGEIMTMPGLPRRPAAEAIMLNPEGEIEGLF